MSPIIIKFITTMQEDDSSVEEQDPPQDGVALNLGQLMQEANAGNRLGDNLHRPAANDQGNGQRNGLRTRVNYENPNDQEMEENPNEPPRNRARPSFTPHDSNCNRTHRIISRSTHVDL